MAKFEVKRDTKNDIVATINEGGAIQVNYSTDGGNTWTTYTQEVCEANKRLEVNLRIVEIDISQ